MPTSATAAENKAAANRRMNEGQPGDIAKRGAHDITIGGFFSRIHASVDVRFAALEGLETYLKHQIRAQREMAALTAGTEDGEIIARYAEQYEAVAFFYRRLYQEPEALYCMLCDAIQALPEEKLPKSIRDNERLLEQIADAGLAVKTFDDDYMERALARAKAEATKQG